MVGRIEKIDLRTVWAHEALNFTTWLQENLDVLSEAIGFNFSLVEREKSVGPFSADILAESTDGYVIIENQLEQTDHTHLGQILTYLSNLEAKTAIWITSSPRPEHINTINWLNEVTPADIYLFLVKVEAIKIGDSEPAPLFSVVSGPSIEGKQIGEKKKELAQSQIDRLEFWESLLEKSKSKFQLFENVSASKENWIAAGAGKSGVNWHYVILKDKGYSQLSIDRGKDKKDETDSIYDKIIRNRDTIENCFGEKLIWDKIEGRLVCYIKSESNIGGLKDKEKWDQIQYDLVDKMNRLESCLGGYI